MAELQNPSTEIMAENNEDYWCYQCNKQVALESQSQMICRECNNGFVEAMATAQGIPRSNTNNRRRRLTHGRNERMENSYQRHIRQILRLFAQASQSNPPYRSAGSGARDGNPREGGNPHQGVDNSEGVTSWDGVNSMDREPADNLPGSAPNPRAANGPGTDDNLIIDANDFSDDDDEENVLRIELDAWESFEDEDDDENDEWEEADEEQAGEDPDEEEPAREETELISGENGGGNDQDGEARQRRINSRREILRLRIRDWNSQSGGVTLETSGRDLDWHEIMQGLQNNSIELRLDLPEEDTYVGNPDDYVDAAGYEVLLQNFLENDNTRKGAPPAATSAVEGLPSVMISKQEVETGSALCAICKDVVPVGEMAKQLPCRHLYHGDCIVSWLGSRNSCPLCRYELPTDDADYEEQKKQRSLVQSATMNSGLDSHHAGGHS